MKTNKHRTTNTLCTFGLIGLSSVALADSIPLDRKSVAEFSVQTIPDHSQVELSEVIAVSGSWTLVNSYKGYRTWEAPLPVRLRSLFFEKPPSGMKVIKRRSADQKWDKGKTLKSAGRVSGKHKQDYWSFSAHSIQVRRAVDEGPPPEWAYAVEFPKALQREKELYFSETNSPPSLDTFTRSLQFEDTTRHGLFLSAPTEVSFNLTVPNEAIFETDGILLPPEAADPGRPLQEDVTLQILLKDENEQSHKLYEEQLLEGHYANIRIDLAPFSGQNIDLTIKSVSQDSGLYQHAFLAEPVVKTPKDNPKTVLLLFLDTLRQDHLSLYGYDRPTTPRIDQWSTNASVFNNARSVAPWTLPSARTMMTGTHPERWGKVPNIQSHFAEQGWATVFIAGNIYLSSTFEMAEDWGTHRCVNWPLADVQVERALEFLDTNTDQDRFMMLHFMDMHLPYTEPLSYRYLFAGERPDELKTDGFLRSEVVRAAKKLGKEAKQHVVDRYDNNLRYLDDVVSDFLEQLPEDTIVAIFADHGEEFWDHNDFEHGHTFYDELLKVPFIIKAPDLEPGSYDFPISLLDLAPTIVRAAGLPNMPTADGWAIQDSEHKDFGTRPLAFGRPLYGDDGWASLYGDNKYIVRSGKESMFDLSTDAVEKINILRKGSDPKIGRIALQEALQTEVVPTLRLKLSYKRSGQEATVAAQSGSPIEYAWRGTDPAKRAPMSLQFQDNALSATWEKSPRTSREIFFVPEGDIQESLNEFKASLSIGNTVKDLVPNANLSWPPPLKLNGKSLMTAKVGSRTATLTYTFAPLPPEGYQDIDAFDDEVSAELKALGYLDE
ncbi:MAG: sulfatase [Myxococcota bacterium]